MAFGHVILLLVIFFIIAAILSIRWDSFKR